MLSVSSKRFLLYFVIIWIALGIWTYTNAKDDFESEEEQDRIYRKVRLFNEILFKLNDNYVTEIPIDSLLDAAIDGMLKKVDPHTHYFNSSDFDFFRSDTEGEFEGLGISIDKQGGYITVIAPIEDTPAFNAGILAGDKIAVVDGKNIKGFSTDEAIELMRGKKGTPVELSIIRPGIEKPLDFILIRDVIKIRSVSYSFMLEDNIGYIRIRSFNANASDDLRQALKKLEPSNPHGYIIDLRYNPGGLLEEAVETVNEFIGIDKRVVFTKSREEENNREYITQRKVEPPGYPIIVMIDHATASAAEIFAGTLQDYDSALIIGEESFGKGSVQQLFPLSQGGIKITTSKYYINSGRCIHKSEADRLESRFNRSKSQPDSTEVFYTLNGRKVFGGGGIMPDIILEPDTLSLLEQKLRMENAFFSYAVEYYADNGNDVDGNFEVDEKILASFEKYLTERDIKIDELSWQESISWIKNRLHAEIAGKKAGTEVTYRIRLELDNQLQQAMEIFRKYKTLEEMFEYANQIRK
ncbi:MAG: S41 family peptidase [Candidatus Cloacimonetes bacterium]|nr:S41 family peptidase [Candidatus Cloacimonadota bacterium]